MPRLAAILSAALSAVLAAALSALPAGAALKPGAQAPDFSARASLGGKESTSRSPRP
jgi:hypothetical protein